MKTKVLSLFCLVIILTAMVNTVSAQINSISVSWNDECLPAVNNTDYYQITVSITRNLDDAKLCDSPFSWTEPYNSNSGTYSYMLDVCFCTDVIGGYHVNAKVQRMTYNNIEICYGETDFDCTCAELQDIDIKIPSMP